MEDYKFLPSFEIGTTTSLDNLKHAYDAIDYKKTAPVDRRLNLNIAELENYFTMIVNMVQRQGGKEFSHKAKMR